MVEKKSLPCFNSEQADLVVKLAMGRLGPDIAGIVANSPLNMNHFVRFMHVAGMCRTRRQERGLSLKEVSAHLKIPQYRLKAIEENGTQSILPDALDRYIEYLGLQQEFPEWLKKNRDVYEALGEWG